MGYLVLPTRGEGDVNYTGATHYNKFFRDNNYSNKYAIRNVICDVTRTRREEAYAYQLVAYGGMGVTTQMSPAVMIKQMEEVQNVNSIEIRGGNRMFHEVFRFTNEEIKMLGYSTDRLVDFAYACSKMYFMQGHQVVFGIHCQVNKNLKVGDSPYHIHFAVNSINYMNGLKWHSFKGKQKEREACFNQLLTNYFIPLPEGLRKVVYFDEKTVNSPACL